MRSHFYWPYVENSRVLDETSWYQNTDNLKSFVEMYRYSYELI